MGTYHYIVMPFGLNNVVMVLIKSMMDISYDMTHNETKVYVDDVIMKSLKILDSLAHLKSSLTSYEIIICS